MTNQLNSKLKMMRKRKGFTQQQLADKLGVTRSTISNYEIGRRRPSVSEIIKLTEIFGVNLDFLGVVTKDEVFDLLCRAKTVFANEEIPKEQKEELYKEIMKLYLDIK